MEIVSYVRLYTKPCIENVWCSPDQDQQVIFKPARISRGAVLRMTLESIGTL